MLQLLAIAAALYTSVVGLRITTALAAVDLGLSPATIGPMLATFSLVPMLFAVSGGRLVDRIGVRRPMMLGALLCGLGAAASALLPHPVVLVAALGCVGLGMMGFHLGMQHAAGEIGGPGRRTANFNMLTMSFSLSGLIGPPVVGIVIDLAGHRVAFATMAALAAGVLLACRRFPFARHLRAGAHAPGQGAAPAAVPAPAADVAPATAADVAPATAPDVAPAPAAPADAAPGADTARAADAVPGTRSAASAGPDAAPPGWRSTFALLAAPRLRRLLIASMTVSAAWDTYQFVMPLHASSRGLSASAVGLAIASFSAGSLTVRLILPYLVARLTPTRWMMLAMGLCVTVYAALPFASNLGVLMAMSFLVGIGPGVTQPLLLAALHGAAPPGRAGEAAGLRLTMMSGMQLALPVCLGLLAAAAGTASVFWFYALVAAAVGAALWRGRAR
jgi:MFS family permease